MYMLQSPILRRAFAFSLPPPPRSPPSSGAEQSGARPCPPGGDRTCKASAGGSEPSVAEVGVVIRVA
eukprot:6701650-Pyramimonas_sp.AAC.1